jgi:hypothetical protein
VQFHRPTHPDCGGQAKAQPRCHRETTATAPVLDSTVFKRQQPRPRLGAMDKLFLVVARRFWAHWEKALVIVLPDTVVRWHRSGFKPCQSGLLSQQIDIQLAPPSSRRRLCRHHRHLLCRRLRLPLPLLPRLALVEGGHRQLPTDQKGLSRGILDVFCSCPMVRLVPPWQARAYNGWCQSQDHRNQPIFVLHGGHDHLATSDIGFPGFAVQDKGLREKHSSCTRLAADS